ncbi:RING-H2 finger protein ATL16-like isoform X2 [Salvia hispanica]|uniref:RING-H2 finger protein ATL16-like isoform X2 n=1 Tax=Salvia hispanica TaxID=49212 RepID=UPI0020099705|nr:RING-H2 finger protein ATL16-like isoform X2 [Salvia hispanica]
MDLSPTKSPPPPLSLFGSSSHSHTSFPIIAVAVIGILATAILLVSYYIFVIKCCLTWHRIDLLHRFSFSRRRPSQDNPLLALSSPADNRGLNAAAIRSIPILNFIQNDAKSYECAVCLNEFQQGEKLRQIPNCCHVFHIDCIDIWLQNNANCPLCRTSISARPEILLPMERPLGPDQDPRISADPFTSRDEDYVVIEIGTSSSLPGTHQRASSDELGPRKKVKKMSHVSSMGDECIDSRRRREVVQPMRRSFSMDSAADSQLYLAVQEIIQRHGHGRFSRSAVQPVTLEPRG